MQDRAVFEHFGRDLFFVKEQVGRGIAVEGELTVARRVERDEGKRRIGAIRAENRGNIHICRAQNLEDVCAEGILTDLRDHFRLAAEPRDCRCNIGGRAACHTLELLHLVERAALLLRHEVDEQFTDRNCFFHSFSSRI